MPRHRQDSIFPSWLKPHHGRHGRLRQNSRRAGGDPGRHQQHLHVGGEQHLPRPERAGHGVAATASGPCFLPVRRPRCDVRALAAGRNLRVGSHAVVVEIDTLRHSLGKGIDRHGLIWPGRPMRRRVELARGVTSAMWKSTGSSPKPADESAIADDCMIDATEAGQLFLPSGSSHRAALTGIGTRRPGHQVPLTAQSEPLEQPPQCGNGRLQRAGAPMQCAGVRGIGSECPPMSAERRNWTT